MKFRVLTLEVRPLFASPEAVRGVAKALSGGAREGKLSSPWNPFAIIARTGYQQAVDEFVPGLGARLDFGS